MANLDSCLAFIFGCLDDQEKLEKRLELKQKECEKDTTNVENEINQISQELDEKKKITSATSFKKALEYVKMLDCVKYLVNHVEAKKVVVKRRLSVLQSIANFFYSIFYILSYRCYKETEIKIESVLKFGDVGVFEQFNTVSQKDLNEMVMKNIDNELGKAYC